MFFGDFDVDVSDKAILDNQTNQIKQPNCFKNLENPSCIDLFLTNRPRRFCNFYVIETGLLDFNMTSFCYKNPLQKAVTTEIIRNFLTEIS